MINFFRNSFKLKKIFSNKEKSLLFCLFYFIFLVLLISFPFGYQTIKYKGFDINSISTGLKQNTPSWFPSELSNDLKFTKTGIVGLNQEYIFEGISGNNETFKVIITPNENYETDEFSIILKENSVELIDNEKNVLKGDYRNITEFSVIELKTLCFDGKETEAMNLFANMIDVSVQRYYDFYSIVMNFLINLLINSLLIVICAALLTFIRINNKRVTTYKENIVIVISSMTIPAIINFLFGLIFVSIGLYSVTSFSSVIFQFLTPILSLVAIKKGSLEKEVLTKGL